jgi:hypothetical protein
MENQQNGGMMKLPIAAVAPVQKHTIRIGRPGYKVRSSSPSPLSPLTSGTGDQVS